MDQQPPHEGAEPDHQGGDCHLAVYAKALLDEDPEIVGGGDCDKGGMTGSMPTRIDIWLSPFVGGFR